MMRLQTFLLLNVVCVTTRMVGGSPSNSQGPQSSTIRREGEERNLESLPNKQLHTNEDPAKDVLGTPYDDNKLFVLSEISHNDYLEENLLDTEDLKDHRNVSAKPENNRRKRQTRHDTSTPFGQGGSAAKSEKYGHDDHHEDIDDLTRLRPGKPRRGRGNVSSEDESDHEGRPKPFGPKSSAPKPGPHSSGYDDPDESSDKPNMFGSGGQRPRLHPDQLVPSPRPGKAYPDFEHDELQSTTGSVLTNTVVRSHPKYGKLGTTRHRRRRRKRTRTPRKKATTSPGSWNGTTSEQTTDSDGSYSKSGSDKQKSSFERQKGNSGDSSQDVMKNKTLLIVIAIAFIILLIVIIILLIICVTKGKQKKGGKKKKKKAVSKHDSGDVSGSGKTQKAQKDVEEDAPPEKQRSADEKKKRNEDEKFGQEAAPDEKQSEERKESASAKTAKSMRQEENRDRSHSVRIGKKKGTEVYNDGDISIVMIG